MLFQAALAAKWKEPPRDALDTMVLKTSGQVLPLIIMCSTCFIWAIMWYKCFSWAFVLGLLLYMCCNASRVLIREWKEPPRDALDIMVLKTSGQVLPPIITSLAIHVFYLGFCTGCSAVYVMYCEPSFKKRVERAPA